MKQTIWKEYFSFTRKERNAVMVLVVLITLFFILPSILPQRVMDQGTEADSLLLLNASRLPSVPKDSGYYKTRPAYSRYKSWYAERKKYPYDPTPARNYKAYQYPYKKQYLTDHPRPAVPLVYLNEADTADLLPLPGIGMKLAARIISFRDKLGGFYDINQLAETYGLPDSTFQRIKEKLHLGTKSLKQIDVNTAGLEQLRQHPYIRWHIANAIIAYRNQHGIFKDIQDLLKIDIITQEIYSKVSYYLTVEGQDESAIK